MAWAGRIVRIVCGLPTTEKNFKSRMLLQVHDEIVLEVPNDELTAVRQLVKETMEAVIELAVPLVADENAGQTWYEAK